jgi:hypothetical protein
MVMLRLSICSRVAKTNANWLNFISGNGLGQPPASTSPPSVESRKSTSSDCDHHEGDVNVQVAGGVRVAAAGTATRNDVKIQPSKASSVPDGGGGGGGE